MKFIYLMLLPSLAYVGYAQADIYKRVDANGNVTYSNTPIKGGKKIELEPLPTMAPFKANEADTTRINHATQKSRDNQRRQILEDEMATEQRALEEARQKLKDAQDNPQMSHANGKTFRNVEGQDQAVQAAQEQVSLHERNVEALKMELSQFK
jgi:multidrug resistance efflux pump